jgi:hypothetical protein
MPGINTRTRTEARATHHLGDIAGTITEEALLRRREEEVVQRGYHLLQSLQTLSTTSIQVEVLLQ